MRDEMARGVHQIGKIFDGLIGERTAVTDMALETINEAELKLELQLSMSQWAAVQALVEAGIKKGYARGREDASIEFSG